MRKISCNTPFLVFLFCFVMFLSGFGSKIILVFKWVVMLSFILFSGAVYRRLLLLSVAWKNSPLKQSGHGVFFMAKALITTSVQIFNVFLCHFRDVAPFKGFVCYTYIFKYPFFILVRSVGLVVMFCLFNPNIVNLYFSSYIISIPHILLIFQRNNFWLCRFLFSIFYT